MTSLEAKFAREAKDRPTDWIIAPAGYDRFKLVNIGPPRDYVAPIATIGEETSVPHLKGCEVSWLQKVLAGDSKIKQEIVELARRAEDDTLPARDRLIARMELGMVVQAGEQIQSLVSELDEPADDKPKYVWRNGAKVKVQ